VLEFRGLPLDPGKWNVTLPKGNSLLAAVLPLDPRVFRGEGVGQFFSSSVPIFQTPSADLQDRQSISSDLAWLSGRRLVDASRRGGVGLRYPSLPPLPDSSPNSFGAFRETKVSRSLWRGLRPPRRTIRYGATWR